MASLRSLRLALTLVAAGSTGLVAACARQGAPPGGPEDRRPPVVVATEPEPFAILTEPFRGPVKFRFDERVSERVASGTVNDAVLVSPRTGNVRVKSGRQSLSVEMDGGFKPGLVYRVTLLPVVRDLFNNQITDPFELVFSTGGEFNASAVAGLVWDRTTGEGVRDMDVLAIEVAENGDSVIHVAKTDTGGVYVFRYLPPARYDMVAFEDRNRNGEVDRMEVQGNRALRLVGPDTALTPIGVLQPDTTPARLVRATPLDSVTLLLDFDDYLDPQISAAQIGISLTREEGESPTVDMAFHAPQYLEWRGAIQDSLARVDSLAAAAQIAERRARARAAASADSAVIAGDSLATTADTARVGRPPARVLPPELPPGPPGSAAPSTRRSGGLRGETGPQLNPDGQPLPSRRVVVRLAGFLEFNAAYQLSVNVVTNLNGLPLGGGEAAVVLEPPKDTTTVPDSAAAGDSLPPDTAVVPPDTSLTPPDTGAVAGGRLLFIPGRRR